jgi:hypothetical protein
MIECIPAGIFSWNYSLTGDGHAASLEVAWFDESGFAQIDGAEYRIRKQGWLSGRWTMSNRDGVIFKAKKLCAFSRFIEISLPDSQKATLCPRGFGRAMELEAPEGRSQLTPLHWFGRSTRIHGSITDFRLLAFSFWLTALLWRRASS